MVSSNGAGDRLDRLEALAETILLAIQQQQQQINQNSLAIQQQQQQINQQSTDIRDGFRNVAELVGRVVEQVERNSEAIREMQSEVRGLQAENRNIIAILMNQRNE